MSKVLQNAPLGAFCNTFELHQAIISPENKFVVSLRVGVLHRFYCFLQTQCQDPISVHLFGRKYKKHKIEVVSQLRVLPKLITDGRMGMRTQYSAHPELFWVEQCLGWVIYVIFRPFIKFLQCIMNVLFQTCTHVFHLRKKLGLWLRSNLQSFFFTYCA